MVEARTSLYEKRKEKAIMEKGHTIEIFGHGEEGL